MTRARTLRLALPHLLYSHPVLYREKEPSNTKFIKCVFFFVGLEEVLADSCELECAGIDEGVMDMLHSARIVGCVGSEVDDFLFIEEFLEVGKYRSDLETPNLSNFVERHSLHEVWKRLVVGWDFLS